MKKLAPTQIREREVKKIAYLLAWRKAMAATKEHRIKGAAIIQD